MLASIISLPVSAPLSTSFNNNLKHSTFACMVKPNFEGVRGAKAVGERRNGTEPLQKSNNQRQQPNARIAAVTPIGIWDRFPTARTVQQMLDTMERIVEDPVAFPSLNEESGIARQKRRTPWEIREGENEYKMRFDMPGMNKRDVKVWAEENMLVVKAEKTVESVQAGEPSVWDWPAQSYGKYSHRISLPENVEAEKIKAEVKDGVLYILIPKEKISSKVVEINVQ